MFARGCKCRLWKNLQLACFLKEDNNIFKFCIENPKTIMLSQIIRVYIIIRILKVFIINYSTYLLQRISLEAWFRTFCFTNIAGACVPFNRKESNFPGKDYRASALNLFPRSKRGSFSSAISLKRMRGTRNGVLFLKFTILIFYDTFIVYVYTIHLWVNNTIVAKQT